MATDVNLNPHLSHGISYVRGGVEPLENHNGGDNGNGILEILKCHVVPCEVSRPVQRHVIHITQRRKRTVPQTCITENEPENTRRSLEAGVHWHLFVQVRYKRRR